MKLPFIAVFPTSQPAMRFKGERKADHDPITRKVLIVDDNPINRLMHARSVEKLNQEQTVDHFETTQAKNGPEALEKIEQAYQENEPYELLITDNNMLKENDGLNLVRSLGSKRPPFITMISSDKVEKEAVANGIQAFYPKPANLDNFRDILEHYKGTLTCPLPESKYSENNVFAQAFAQANQSKKRRSSHHDLREQEPDAKQARKK